MKPTKFIISVLAGFSIAASPVAFPQTDQDMPNALLEISVNGVVHKGEYEFVKEGINDSATARQFFDQNSIKLPKNGSVQLAITLVTPDGKRKDVTSDQGHMWVMNQTSWIFRVKAPGLLVQDPNPIYASDPNLMQARTGQIMYIYRDGRIFAYNSVLVEVER